jgi:hypothetical protein
MSTFKVDLDYNAAHVKDKILILEAIYQELLRQEKIQEDEEEQRRLKCKVLKKQTKSFKEFINESETDGEEESKEIEPIPEPIVEPVVGPVVVEEPKKESNKIICECGIEIVKRNMKRHCTSKNHIFNMEIKKKGNVVPL